ncbi:hypothetical protein KVP04_08335, partial [Halobacterium salinarum]|uniref:hypothetical protein n=2 Tax=Halobacteriaceae TaxID=2236 RepID=UPI001F33918B
LAREVGTHPDPVVTAAGAVADGVEPPADVRAAAEAWTRRPGVGVPTADLAAGLAHSTLVHASFSGDEQAAGAFLAELGLPPEPDAAARRRLASAVALDATADAPPCAADAVHDALRPRATPDGMMATVEGYADVLNAVAWAAPGHGVALGLGVADRTAVLAAWQAHAAPSHAAVRAASLARHRGVVVADVPTASPTVARLLRDYRATEPAVIAVGTETAALATTDADAHAVLPGSVGTRRRAVTTLGDSSDADAVIETVRGGL